MISGVGVSVGEGDGVKVGVRGGVEVRVGVGVEVGARSAAIDPGVDCRRIPTRTRQARVRTPPRTAMVILFRPLPCRRWLPIMAPLYHTSESGSQGLAQRLGASPNRWGEMKAEGASFDSPFDEQSSVQASRVPQAFAAQRQPVFGLEESLYLL